MNRSTPQIAQYLEMVSCGDSEIAFHGLIELGREILPGLIEAFRAERDPVIRAFLVGIIWKNREQSAIGFLGEALLDPEPPVWREALDGLVTLASPQALEIMRAARTWGSQSGSDDFICWIDEAIAQAEIALSKECVDQNP